MIEVSELLALRIENYALKIRQLEAIHGEYVKQQAECIKEARREVGAPPDHLYHVERRQFQAPSSEATR